VQVTGKHNCDALRQNPKVKPLRCKTGHLHTTVVDNQEQQLRWCQLLQNNDTDLHGELLTLRRELDSKLAGYKQQDIKRGFVPLQVVTLPDLLEKLVTSALQCVYCGNVVKVLYKEVRDPLQWTLDRKDNSTGHSNLNTVIACLRCNLQRRVQDEDKFMFTKKLVINKTQ
jgi:hypothetical protein